MNKIIRQGDVLLLPIAPAAPRKGIPVPAENGRVVLAHGEVTGHHHSFRLSETVSLFREDGSGSGLFLTVTGLAPAELEHQEHTTLLVPPGSYRVIRQRTATAGVARRVED